YDFQGQPDSPARNTGSVPYYRPGDRLPHYLGSAR
ncbi:unnamed protein product, partial [marine sediment metagenome]